MKRIIYILFLFPFALNAQSKFIRAITPEHLKLQFAGAIGFVSFGAGYESVNEKFQTDVMYGYVPQSLGGVRIHSLTGKVTWLPLKKEFNSWKWNYLTGGLHINYAIGAQYHTLWPDKYPNGYYNYPSALTSSIFAGGQLHHKRSAFYYEAGITDRQVISLIRNPGSVSFFRMVNIGLGLYREI